MKLFQRIKLHLSLFFDVTIPSFWDKCSLFTKISLGCFGFILLHLICILCYIGFFILMSVLNNNKTYELLYPAEEITSIEIIMVDDDVGLYYFPVNEISEILDQRTIPVCNLEDTQIPACIEDLQQLSASKWWNDPTPHITDGTLLVTYQNGSREWISAHGTFYCDASSGEDSMTPYFFDNEEFDTFLISYGYIPPDK